VHYREDICLQTFLLLFKYANHKNKRSFVLTANEALVGTLMTIGDVKNIFPIYRINLHEYYKINMRREISLGDNQLQSGYHHVKVNVEKKVKVLSYQVVMYMC